MFSAFVIVYLFLGGFGSGLLLIAAFASLVFHCALDCNEIEVAAFDEWRNRCFLWGFVIILCGALCLLLDLGKPERFVMLFVRPSSVSVLAYGTMFLTALIACSGFLVFAIFFCRARAGSDCCAQSRRDCVRVAFHCCYDLYRRISHVDAGCRILDEPPYSRSFRRLGVVDGLFGLCVCRFALA